MTRPWERWWEKCANIDHLRGSNLREQPIRQKIVEEVSRVGHSVLDVGCATCIDYPLFKEAGIHYTGVDITKKFINRAKEINPSVDARVGDAFDLQFSDGSYDIVYCKSLLEHLPPKGYERVIKEMWRVAGKQMMIAFYIPPTDSPTVYEIAEGGFYKNVYNKQEIASFIADLEGVYELKTIEGISGHSLYVVRKVEA